MIWTTKEKLEKIIDIVSKITDKNNHSPDIATVPSEVNATKNIPNTMKATPCMRRGEPQAALCDRITMELPGAHQDTARGQPWNPDTTPPVIRPTPELSEEHQETQPELEFEVQILPNL